MSASSASSPVVTVDHARLADVLRPTGFALVNDFLARHAVISAALDMRPNKLLVFMVIATAAVQKAMRDPKLPDDWRGTKRMPRTVIGYISRRAIAEATGLPRENVRRIVNELIAEDRLLIGPRGGVANKGGLLESAQIVASIHDQLTVTARTVQALIDTGVMSVAAPEV
jgi:hypothetical protein